MNRKPNVERVPRLDALHLFRGLLTITLCVVGILPAQLLASPQQSPSAEGATLNTFQCSAQLPASLPDSIATPSEIAAPESISDSLVNCGYRRVVLNPGYGASRIKRSILGSGYRDVWTTPTDVPILDLARTAGGLSPVRRGGGVQTATLHLIGADGHQYVLRSVNKNAPASLPEGFHGTIVADFAQDQISSLNPYGALALPALAQAAGIFHTIPALVYIPDDPRLGAYRDEFAGMVALFERRPDEDQSDAAHFGNATNVIGTEKLLEELREDNDEYVDERAYVRARLFDMLVGDWDRHDDQWRWAEFDLPDDRKRYVPIPRDRDFAFVRYEGLINRSRRLTRNIELRRLANFQPEIKDLLGLNWQATHLDLRFASSLTKGDWVEIADSLRLALTDEVIEAAFSTWPDEIYDAAGPGSIVTLRARRDQLPDMASEYYTILADKVDLVGSDKHERFEATRLAGGKTQVVIYKTNKAGDVVRELYRRMFDPRETKEIRLYGLGGNDLFIVRGDERDGILLRIVGGEDGDTLIDQSRVSGFRRLTRYYDSRDGSAVTGGPETKIFLADGPFIHRYGLRKVETSSFKPVSALAYGSDDGLFIGGGVLITRSGFCKEPYAGQHLIALNYAPRSSAFNAFYHGDLIDVWRGWDADLEAEALAAYRFRNFYGFGNETPGTDEQRERFRARIQKVTAEPALSRTLRPNSFIEFGPRFEYTNVEPLEGRSEDDPRSGFEPEDFIDTYYAGIRSAFVLDTRDTLLNTRSGLRWFNEASVNAGLRTVKENFARLATTLSYFYTPPLPTQVTLALRAGGATNIGEFPFWQANVLGGRDNLRGYPVGRFSGRSAVFTNVEMRVRLLDFNVYVTKGDLGIFGFVDNGRVWADGEDSNVWHQGYGGGLWMSPYNSFILTAGIGLSEEHTLFSFSTGFLF